MSSTNIVLTQLFPEGGKSLVYDVNNTGERIPHCGTLPSGLNFSPVVLSILSWADLPATLLQRIFLIIDGNFVIYIILYFNPLSHTLPKALDISLQTMLQWSLYFWFTATISCNLAVAMSVPLLEQSWYC